MPKSSVMGVVIVVMLDGGKGNERLGDGHSDGFMGDNQARSRHASSPDAGIGCVVPGQAARHEIILSFLPPNVRPTRFHVGLCSPSKIREEACTCRPR